MTRAEDKALRRERNRRDYESRKESKKEYSRRWYYENHDHVLKKAAEYRQRRREDAVVTKFVPPSTDALESALPPALRKNIMELRAEYLGIHISRRPPYDAFLKMKTIEHLTKNSI